MLQLLAAASVVSSPRSFGHAVVENVVHVGTNAGAGVMAVRMDPVQKKGVEEHQHVEEKEGECVEECSICLNELVKGKSDIYTVDACGHQFCRGCINDWIEKIEKAKCPNCRGKELKERLTEEQQEKLLQEKVQRAEDLIFVMTRPDDEKWEFDEVVKEIEELAHAKSEEQATRLQNEWNAEEERAQVRQLKRTRDEIEKVLQKTPELLKECMDKVPLGENNGWYCQVTPLTEDGFKQYHEVRFSWGIPQTRLSLWEVDEAGNFKSPLEGNDLHDDWTGVLAALLSAQGNRQ